VKIITDVEQGSVQWLKLRLGIPTASEFHQLMTPLFKAKEGETPKTYLAKKLAEAWRGEPLPGFSSYATEQGTIREEDARPWYALEYDTDVQQVGFVLSDDERCGCSPDGLIGEDSGLEIKCPNPDTHVKYLIAEQLPDIYAAQVHGSMFVTGRKSWRFVSYRPEFPKLVLTIQRDEEIIRKIGAILGGFYREFDAAMESLRRKDAA
jgi:hypothetical protein